MNLFKTSALLVANTTTLMEMKMKKLSSLDDSSFPENVSVCTTDPSTSSQASSVSSSIIRAVEVIKNDDHNDDDDALSITMSSDEDEYDDDGDNDDNQQRSDAHPEPKRSIFRHYWEKSGRAPSRLIRSPFCPPTFVPGAGDADIDDDDIDHHLDMSGLSVSVKRVVRSACPRKSNIDNRRSSMPTLPRRSILPQHSYASTPSFTGGRSTSRSFLTQRKAVSTPHLVRCPQKSCLRQSRFSGAFRRRALEKSVSFGSTVSVQTFERPMEQHASPEWSSQFAT